MKSVHIVIPDLFLPPPLAAYASGDLRMPALEKLLACAKVEPLKIDMLEGWLCEYFGVEDMAIAPLTLQADGVLAGESYWLRADPVGFSMQRDQTVLQTDLALTAEEAAQLCASLNAHFAADGFQFIAPHPQRWYLQLERAPAIQTFPLSQVVGAALHGHLPHGEDALRWHSVFNEIQMLFYEHAVNQARELRGEPVVSAVWLWGGGKLSKELLQPFTCVAGDSELARAFAQAAGIADLMKIDFMLAGFEEEAGDLMMACEGLRRAMQGADIGEWRTALKQFEKNYAEPFLSALAAGLIGKITLDVLNEGASRRFVVTRPGLWRFWRRLKPLLDYSPKQDTP